MQPRAETFSKIYSYLKQTIGKTKLNRWKIAVFLGTYFLLKQNPLSLLKLCALFIVFFYICCKYIAESLKKSKQVDGNNISVVV